MSVIKLAGFQGELPSLMPSILPESAAQEAYNVILAELNVLESTTIGAPTFSNVMNTSCNVYCAASSATNSFRTATISIDAEL